MRKPINVMISFNTLLTKVFSQLQIQRGHCSVYYPSCQGEIIGGRPDTVTPYTGGEARLNRVPDAKIWHWNCVSNRQKIP